MLSFSPFSAFLAETRVEPPLRAAITAAHALPEPDCVPPLLASATLPEGAAALGASLVKTLRAKPRRGPVEALMREYSLSSEEGIALMCLAEALLRIPDTPTRDALIRDKLSGRDWLSHLGHSPSLFVNGATMGLAAAGPLSRLAAPIIRNAVTTAMRLMGEQFVLGETIAQALTRAQKQEADGFTFSYDMLGEAALTAEDAAAYFTAYESAIQAIGAAAQGRGLYEAPGISIKLSALHPRYTRAQRGRVMHELLPQLIHLARLAQSKNIGINIDAEEADRLDLSLDLLEALCTTPAFDNWHGIGFVVQAYQKRAPFVLDYCIDLAKRTGHRLMIRLVKGAYWDAEIKRAQVDGLDGFPVYTRKIYTDISYLACARKMLAAGTAIYPQFATHNALTVAAIHTFAGDAPYEFQCLHGMGEALYEEVVTKLKRTCRIYAPVGTHATLLAYLVRRLLENGANTSFVARIADPDITLEDLLRDPAAEAQTLTPIGRPHDQIPLPANLFAPTRRNSASLDLANEATLRTLAEQLATAPEIPSTNPPATRGNRAESLLHAAEFLEQQRAPLLRLLIEEAKKTLPNAIAEHREAVDYLRYYAAQLETFTGGEIPLGRVVCISPWNFPLAIFLGQIAAAYAAGNTVIAKPAEETPRIAAAAISLLHRAGVPVQLVQGPGAVGAALVAEPGVDGVLFTGSTAVARRIQRSLSTRLGAGGKPITLIAETGGQNAMIVDSSALPEQVVTDILHSAFDSAGQRCSALRLLCLQDDAAPRILPMLKSAMRERSLGPPGRLATDIGPVITEAAASRILNHIETQRSAGFTVTTLPVPAAPCFVPPTLVELPGIHALGEEIFGPVLHVIQYRGNALDALVDAINALGYGLTFGLHTRIDAVIARVTSRIQAGNIYVNRNIVGAVVGSQPFGGHGLSGTGPKAGGPLTLRRLIRNPPTTIPPPQDLPSPAGERNHYALRPSGAVLCLATTPAGRDTQRAACDASANHAVFSESDAFDAVLLEGEPHDALRVNAMLAGRPGPIIPLQTLTSAELAAGHQYNPVWLMRERVISTNTTATGGNASLLTLR